jgi:uncharacterized DUF497 family protein
MAWIWDEEKSLANRRKHGLAFDLAQRVFDDPFALSQRDPYPGEERWRTIGMVGGVVILVVHTWSADAEEGRIISARKATTHERQAYEEDERS